jgi:hypothetical protein
MLMRISNKVRERIKLTTLQKKVINKRLYPKKKKKKKRRY